MLSSEEPMVPDLVVVHSPVGGGHKAAALAATEAARARGLSVVILDAFKHAPRVFGQAYLAAHLKWQGAMPELYGTAYFAFNRPDGAFEPVRRGIDHVALGRLVRQVAELRPRAVIATHHLPLVVLARARRRGRLHAPLVGVVTDYTSHAHWAEEGVDAFCVPCGLAGRELTEHGAHHHPQIANARKPTHLLRINRDSLERHDFRIRRPFFARRLTARKPLLVGPTAEGVSPAAA
jgi:hypothetical protein